MLGSDSRIELTAHLQGLQCLGPRLSEEPYSTGDKRLLASVASQAGIAMRSISLAEKMAERMEGERRSEQEMQIARQVQSRLLPQQAPMLRRWNAPASAFRREPWAETITTFWTSAPAGWAGVGRHSGKGISARSADGEPAG